MRVRLEPLDDHDRSVDAFVQSLPEEARADLERSRRERAEEARLDRIRGR
jgi:hypothetical protein